MTAAEAADLLGVDPLAVDATGPGGRITGPDILRHLVARAAGPLPPLAEVLDSIRDGERRANLPSPDVEEAIESLYRQYGGGIVRWIERRVGAGAVTRCHVAELTALFGALANERNG